MSKANIFTTPIRSRRAVLASIAATTAVTVAGARPTDAAPAIDPIFAAIEAHRDAYATMEAVFAEHRRAHELADAKVGPSHLDIPSMVEPGTTVNVSCWWDIERAVPCKQYPDLYAHHNRLLKERRAAHGAIVESQIGDEDEATDEVSGSELAALRQFANTVPTTLAGLLAMIIYTSELDDEDPNEVFADCRETLATAAQALMNSSGRVS